MMFYASAAQQFPDKYKNAIFVAQHGSWDRSPMLGYRIGVVFVSGTDDVTGYDIFAQGWCVCTDI